MGIIAVVLAIVIAAPQYSDPVIAGVGVEPPAVEELSTAADEEAAEVKTAELVLPTSKSPDRLKGYRWPVRGGQIARYYEAHSTGEFQIDGERMHDGIIITWFEGAAVKAAHKGTVIAAGRDWAEHVGFMGDLDLVYAKYAPIGDSKKARKSDKPLFPNGVVIDDGNDYYSVYTEIKDLEVKPGDKVKSGQTIGYMSKAEGMQMMRYRLVRTDGLPMKVHSSARDRGYPLYAAERVNPLAVLKTTARKMPRMDRKAPKDPPQLSEYQLR